MDQNLSPDAHTLDRPVSEARPPATWWLGLGSAVGLLVWPTLVSLPLAVPGVLIAHSHPWWGSLLLSLGSVATVAAVWALARGAWKGEWRRAFPLARVSGGLLFWVWLCTLAYLLVMAGWYAGIAHFRPLPDLPAFRDMAWPVMALMIPLGEEIVFRGYGLARIRELAGDRRALLLTAAFFALAHLTWVKFPDAFLGGLFCGWLVLRSGSLWPGILAHATVNGVACIADRWPATANLELKAVPWSGVVLLFAAGVLILLALFSRPVRGWVRELRGTP